MNFINTLNTITKFNVKKPSIKLLKTAIGQQSHRYIFNLYKGYKILKKEKKLNNHKLYDKILIDELIDIYEKNPIVNELKYLPKSGQFPGGSEYRKGLKDFKKQQGLSVSSSISQKSWEKYKDPINIQIQLDNLEKLDSKHKYKKDKNKKKRELKKQSNLKQKKTKLYFTNEKE